MMFFYAGPYNIYTGLVLMVLSRFKFILLSILQADTPENGVENVDTETSSLKKLKLRE